MASGFRFKRFAVSHDGPAMKVGTDGVLLGAWCTMNPNISRILDIGTGTGVISLMLAQRGEATGLTIDALDIDSDICRQAACNTSASEWATRIYIHCRPVQDFARESSFKYDLIVSNPPFFEESLQPPLQARARARHTTCLTYSELLDSAVKLMTPDGIFAVILPFGQSDKFIGMAGTAGMSLTRRTDVIPVRGGNAKRSLLEFRTVPNDIATKDDTLTIEKSPLCYTEEYKALTRDFYLKF